MNEKEAKETVANHKKGNCEECFEGSCQDEAAGYLECLEKARGLEEALEKVSKYECGCFSGCGPCLDITNRVAAETLSKWQEEK